MTDQEFTTDGLEMIVGNYLQELEDAPDRDAVTRKYVEAYPAIATVIQDLSAQERIFNALRPDGGDDYPKHLPDFHILREIGRGGMGVVFEARQESLDRCVALKLLKGKLKGTELDRFRREQLVLARLHQTNIVPIHVSGEHGPWHYFAMAYVEGASLHQIIRRTHCPDTLRRDQTPTLAETAREELKNRRTASRRRAVACGGTGECQPAARRAGRALGQLLHLGRLVRRDRG
jgi:hypothetical protein